MTQHLRWVYHGNIIRPIGNRALSVPRQRPLSHQRTGSAAVSDLWFSSLRRIKRRTAFAYPRRPASWRRFCTACACSKFLTIRTLPVKSVQTEYRSRASAIDHAHNLRAAQHGW